MTQQPNHTDAVLGGQSLSNSLSLGGVEGLRQRFKFVSSDLKMDLLTDTLNYDVTLRHNPETLLDYDRSSSVT